MLSWNNLSVRCSNFELPTQINSPQDAQTFVLLALILAILSWKRRIASRVVKSVRVGGNASAAAIRLWNSRVNTNLLSHVLFSFWIMELEHNNVTPSRIHRFLCRKLDDRIEETEMHIESSGFAKSLHCRISGLLVRKTHLLVRKTRNWAVSKYRARPGVPK